SDLRSPGGAARTADGTAPATGHQRLRRLGVRDRQSRAGARRQTGRRAGGPRRRPQPGRECRDSRRNRRRAIHLARRDAGRTRLRVRLLPRSCRRLHADGGDTMTPLLLFTLGDHPALQPALLAAAGAEAGHCEVRHFPDGESYVRVLSECAGRRTAILCTLHRPDELFLPLLFLAGTLRELGARSVGLVAPYLAYMRQDKRFLDGEAITSRQ